MNPDSVRAVRDFRGPFFILDGYVKKTHTASMADIIEISKRAQKDLRKLPDYIVRNFQEWMLAVEDLGIVETRKIKGYRDEALTGNRSGQRSARLSRAYRVIYTETPEDGINIVCILEVNKHDY
jgi:toxin HigB-1